MTLLQRINTGCSLINIMIYPLIIVYSWVLPMNTFLRFVLTLISLIFIYSGIYIIQNTQYKLIDLKII